VRQANKAYVILEASAQAPDGALLSDRRLCIANGTRGLPTPARLEAEAESLAKDVALLSRARLIDSYVGPVLFEGQATGELFEQLLSRNLSAPRGLWVEDENVQERFKAGELTSRLGLRVLSANLDARDDPAAAAFDGTDLVGGYAFDEEGIAPTPVALVEKGILRGLPMSRSPTKDLRGSNGHARAAPVDMPTGRTANLFVTARSPRPEADMKGELLRQAREFGLLHAMIVRRLGDESAQEEAGRLAAPVLLYKVRVADGREELLRGAEFSGVTLRALRDIAAASDRARVHNVLQLGPYRDWRGEIPTSVVHPHSVLVAEMEIKKSEKKPERLPYLARPRM